MFAEDSEEVLLTEYALSRSIALQLTAISVVGFLFAVAGIGTLYEAFTGDGSVFVVTMDGWWTVVSAFLVVVLLTVGTIGSHELCHGLAIRAFGGEPRYGAGVAHFFFPYAYTTTEARFTRNQFVVIALAPLVVLTVVGVALMVAFELRWLLVPLALNVAGAAGDLWMTLTLLGYPADVSVLDTETGLRVYGRSGTVRRETDPTAVVWDVLIGTSVCVGSLLLLVGIVVPVVLSVLDWDSITVGSPGTPLFVFVFERSDGVKYSVGPGGFLPAPIVGLLYAFARSRRRRRRRTS